MGNGAQLIRQRQAEWADRAGIRHLGGYCATPADNLPWLSTEIRAEIERGDGNEFGRPGEPGKIAALHSSSALAVNVFGYWHNRPAAELAAALGLTSGIDRIEFERKFPTGVGPKSPNMDITLTLADGSLLAIESKFCESYAGKSGKAIQEKYFPGGRKLWADAGLSGAQAVVDSSREGALFRWLDAPQLLKHMLGLAKTLEGRSWRLILLWFDAGVPAAEQMRAEAGNFADRLGQDASSFSVLTYQDLWQVMIPRLGGEHRPYKEYIGRRYFPEP